MLRMLTCTRKTQLTYPDGVFLDGGEVSERPLYHSRVDIVHRADQAAERMGQRRHDLLVMLDRIWIDQPCNHRYLLH